MNIAAAASEPPAALHQFRSQHGRTLDELSRERPVLTVFLRHSGCTFCRETLSDLQQQRPTIEARGFGIAIVHMSDDAEAAGRFARYGLGDVDRFSDPECRLYRAFEIPEGTVRQLLGLRVWARGFVAALVKGHGFGRIRGNVFQMPGTFVLHHGRVVAAQRHRTAAERVDFEQLVCETPPADRSPSDGATARH